SIIVAMAYLLLGEINSFKVYGYRALYYTRNKEEEKLICSNYNSGILNMKISNSYEDLKRIKAVKRDTIVTLQSIKNKGNIIRICFNQELEYQKDKKSIGCLHISKGNELWQDLLGEKVGDIIKTKL